MLSLSYRDLKRLAVSMQDVLEDPPCLPAQALALGVVVLLLGPLPEASDRRCRLSGKRLMDLPAEWPDVD